MDVKKRNGIRLAVLLIAIGFMVFGIYRGEADQVYKKAIEICLSCMGIG